MSASTAPDITEERPPRCSGRGARLLAAADVYHAMTEPRPHREAHSPEQAADTLSREARAGRLGADAVVAVLHASGHQAPRIERPAGLTDREAEVIGLLARGLQTKRCACTWNLGQDRRPPHPKRIREDRSVDARGGGAVRDGARSHVMGRTPYFPHRRPPVASSPTELVRRRETLGT